MHRIDHPTATADKKFTRGDQSGGISATVITPEWMNAVQEELAALIEGAGLTLNKNNNAQALAAVLALASGADMINPVGKIELFDDYTAPSPTNPRLALHLPDQDLSASNWPDLVPYLRGKKLTYMPGTVSSKTDFQVASWAISSNVVTLTFADIAGEKAVLAALLEDAKVQGGDAETVTHGRTVTVPAFGTVTAGDYAITAINVSARTLSFAFTAANASGSTPFNVQFYRHRIAGDVTTARHFKVAGRGFITAGDGDGEVIPGLRRRDRGQGHRHASNVWAGSAGTSYGTGVIGPVHNDPNGTFTLDPIADPSNGTPRTGKTTDIRSMGVIATIWGKRYIPS